MPKSLPLHLRLLLWPFSWLPLPAIHALGVLLGWAMYLLSPRTARIMRENLQNSGLFPEDGQRRRVLRSAIGESGKVLLETFAIWLSREARVHAWVRGCQGWGEVEAALAEGKGILFLTPHQGCYEITSIHYGAAYPVTVLYRPPKQAWLQPLIESGRSRGKATLAEANTRGVRDLLLALKRKEAIGILPDQIPAEGEGEWAPFFGRPAYSMTLASRLAEKTGAAILMAFGERLPYGRGFIVHYRRLPDGCIDSVAGLNAAIEAQVARCPQQYLWSYNRFKLRRAARAKLPPQH